MARSGPGEGNDEYDDGHADGHDDAIAQQELEAPRTPLLIVRIAEKAGAVASADH